MPEQRNPNLWRHGLMLPWGNLGFDVAALNDNGRTIMRKSIEWAAGAGEDPTGVVFEEYTETMVDNNSREIVINKPAGTQEKDLLIAAVSTDGDNDDELTAPPGWNVFIVEEQFDAVTFGVWWKIADTVEPAAYTFEWPAGFSEDAYGWIMRFSGHDLSNPINAWSIEMTGSNVTNNPPSPEVTTTVDNAMILRVAGFDDDDISVDDPGLAGNTPITMQKSNTGRQATSGGAGYSMLNTAGASGTSSFSLTGQEQTIAITIAIAPDPNE